MMLAGKDWVKSMLLVVANMSAIMGGLMRTEPSRQREDGDDNDDDGGFDT